MILLQKSKYLPKKQIVSNKDLINPIINRAKSGVHGGIDKLNIKTKAKLEELVSKVNEKVDQYIQPIEGEGVKRGRGRPRLTKGEGIIGDTLKGLIGMTGLT